MGYAGGEINKKHLIFRKIPIDGKKMPIYQVLNTTLLNEEIGIIHWRGGWRQFVFQARDKVDMSQSCHKEIDEFIDGLMTE